jgi:hypothetical protein
MRKVLSQAARNFAEPSSLNAESLREALTLLATDRESQPARDRAARILLKQLRTLANRAVLARFARWSAFRRRGELAEVLEDAIQHVALVASTGQARFRGQHPSEAVAWCQRIFMNFLASESRRRARTVLLAGDERESRALLSDAHLEGVSWRNAGQETALILLRLEGCVRNHLQQTRTPSAFESLYRAVRRYLRYITGHPEHGATGGALPGDGAGSQAARRARDREYQRHSRARRVLAEVIAAEVLRHAAAGEGRQGQP